MRDQAVCRPAPFATRAAGRQSGRDTLDGRQRRVQGDRALDRLRQPPRRAEPVFPPVGLPAANGHDAAPLGDQQETPHGVPASRNDRRREEVAKRRVLADAARCRLGQGIEPYRAWVRQNIKRVVPLPEHVRRGLGFRTVWLSRYYPDDPQDANWTFADLPSWPRKPRNTGWTKWSCGDRRRASSCRCRRFTSTSAATRGLSGPWPSAKNSAWTWFHQCLQCQGEDCRQVRPEGRGQPNWTFHPEFIPRFQPPYANAYSCVQIDSHNPVWQREVRTSCRRVDMGIPSLSWDQYLIEPPEPNVLTLTRQIRDYSRRRDPQSTFSAEEFSAMEVSCDYLDYTWNWNTLKDCRAVTSVVSHAAGQPQRRRLAGGRKWGFA